MAPYTPFNHTQAHAKDFLPVPTHSLLLRHSLETTVFSVDPTPALRPELIKEVPVATMPYLGIGPLALQPSGTHSVDAENNASTNEHPSPRLAYLAILAIPLISGLVVFLLLRRRKQRPAKRSAPPPLTLRSETARARLDAECPRMQQLPRDRIRAMNSVPRDNGIPMSPPAEYQIFSPRLESPPLNEYPRPLGNYLDTLAVPGSSELSSPSMTSATSLGSCPTTPCTPTFVGSFALSPNLEAGSEKDDNNGEKMRFTWDFRCQGAMNKHPHVSVGSVLDISHANSILVSTEEPDSNVNYDGSPLTQESIDASRENAEHVSEKVDASLIAGTTLSVDCPVLHASEALEEEPLLASLGGEEASSPGSHDKCPLVGRTIPANNDDSKFDVVACSPVPNLYPLDCERSSAPTPLIEENDQPCLGPGLTVLDLKLDVTSFSSEVNDALSESSNCTLDEISDDNSPLQPDHVVQQAPRKNSDARKRPILSKPNHRTLEPASPSLRVHGALIDTGDCTGSPTEPAFLLCAPGTSPTPLDATVVAGSDLHDKSCFQTETGLKRATSETSIYALRKSCLYGDLPELKASGILPYELPEISPVQSSLISKVVSATRREAIRLRSSLSMPLAVELACLSSIERRLKNKDN